MNALKVKQMILFLLLFDLIEFQSWYIDTIENFDNYGVQKCFSFFKVIIIVFYNSFF